MGELADEVVWVDFDYDELERPEMKLKRDREEETERLVRSFGSWVKAHGLTDEQIATLKAWMEASND